MSDPAARPLRRIAPISRWDWRRSCCWSTRDTLQLAHVADRVLPGSALPRDQAGPRGVPGRDRGALQPAGSVADAIEQLAEGRTEAIRAGGARRTGRHAPRRRPAPRRAALRRRAGRSRSATSAWSNRCRASSSGRPSARSTSTWDCRAPTRRSPRMNGIRERLPLLHGLGANSPFWFGADSGMASSRAAVIRAYPGRGIPPVLALLGRVPRLPRRRARRRRSHRPHDGVVGRSPSAAARHCRAARDGRPDRPRVGGRDRRAGARDHDDGRWRSPVSDPAPEQALHWSSFRAARDGLDAEIWFDGSPRPLREVAETRARPDRRRSRPRARGHKANRPRGRRSGPAASRLQ